MAHSFQDASTATQKIIEDTVAGSIPVGLVTVELTIS